MTSPIPAPVAPAAPERFDPDSRLFASAFAESREYDAYVATGTDAHRKRWAAQQAAVRLSGPQRTLLGSFTRRMHLLCISGVWCGDCIRFGPILQAIAAASPVIALRFLERDERRRIRDRLRTVGAARVPVTLVLDEDFAFADRFGDRSLATYRRMAREHLGDRCPVGVAPADADELGATIAETVDRLERVQLMLRLAPHLRQRHGD
ncbi:MAG TPA: thioredoxin family protein [Candidatus Eisenbacteria bacterium]|nr:thioredoxin family protein [Candidatus Eisenbacteria bacterium]